MRGGESLPFASFYFSQGGQVCVKPTGNHPFIPISGSITSLSYPFSLSLFVFLSLSLSLSLPNPWPLLPASHGISISTSCAPLTQWVFRFFFFNFQIEISEKSACSRFSSSYFSKNGSSDYVLCYLAQYSSFVLTSLLLKSYDPRLSIVACGHLTLKVSEQGVISWLFSSMSPKPERFPSFGFLGPLSYLLNFYLCIWGLQLVE